ncbi:MAG: ComEA family DNA-binding protein [Polyangiales bacterium]
MKAALAVVLSLLALHVGAGAAADDGLRPLQQGPPSQARDNRININEAGVDELVQLPGIGPARAEAIIAEREKRRFRRIEDILRVPGIGRKTFGRIRHSIRVR